MTREHLHVIAKGKTMAITPRSFLRNPMLLTLLCVVGLIVPSALLFSMSPCTRGDDASAQQQVTHEVTFGQSISQQQQQAAFQAPIQNADTLADRQGWLGVRIQTLNKTRARYASVEPTRGVLVLDLLKSRPAETAGFAAYDVITHFNGKRMTSSCQLKRTILASAPGTRVPVKVVRDGVELTLYPTLTSAAKGRPQR